MDKIAKLKNHFIICGGGRMAYAIASEFSTAGKTFVIIENNPESRVSEMESSWPILQKDALLEDTLIAAGIERAAGLASVLPTDADNLFVVLSARHLNQNIRIETRISQESSRSKMIQAGADKIVSPYVLGGIQMARSFLDPHVDEFLDIMVDKLNYEFELSIHKVRAGDPEAGRYIRDTDFTDRGFIIIGIKDREDASIKQPKADYKLRVGDELVMVTTGIMKSLDQA